MKVGITVRSLTMVAALAALAPALGATPNSLEGSKATTMLGRRVRSRRKPSPAAPAPQAAGATKRQIGAVRSRMARLQRAAAAANGGVVAPAPAVAAAPPVDLSNMVTLPWSLAAGRPDVQAGTPAGFWIWHEGGIIYVATTSQNREGLTFGGGALVLGGVISAARGIMLENVDLLRQPKPNVLRFRFRTYTHLDGIQFRVQGGTRLGFQLNINGQPAQRAFVGRNQVPAGENPVAFDPTR